MRLVSLTLLLILTTSYAWSKQAVRVTTNNKTITINKETTHLIQFERDLDTSEHLLLQSLNDSLTSSQKKQLVKRKIIAVTLAVTLGVFGVHRLYLGTSAKIPIIYTLTLGGGFGVLMVADIIAIISAKDLDAYAPNSNIFMWAQ